MTRNAGWVSLLIVAALGAALPGKIGAQTGGQSGSARVLFLQGQDLLDEGRFADAEKKFREAQTKYPKALEADRTAYYLITTLMKQGRAVDAQAEIENFSKSYPQSDWRPDVEEMRIALRGRAVQVTPAPLRNPGVVVAPQQAPLPANPWGGQVHWDDTVNVYLHNLQSQPFYRNLLSGSASLAAELLRLILEMDADHGIQIATDRLKTDASDPAVVSNLSTIANSKSAQSLPFLMDLAGNSSVPNVRSQAIFWLGQAADPKVRAFLMDAARNDKDLAVRRAAVQAFASRKDADVKTLEEILRSLPPVQK